MALAGNRRQGVTINDKTWFYAGITFVVMGLVTIAAGLVLQQQLHRLKCDDSVDCVFQSLNVKASRWCGISIGCFGLLTLSIGCLRRNKAMMITLSVLIVLPALLALALLLISEVNIASSYIHSMSFNPRWTEVNNGEPLQPIAVQHGEPSLQFSPSDKMIAFDGRLLRGNHGNNIGGKSSTMNSDNKDHDMKYLHESGAYSGNRLVGSVPENNVKRDHDLLNGNKVRSGGDALNFEEMPPSSVDVSLTNVARNAASTNLRGTDDSPYEESSGFGGGYDDDDDDDDDGFEADEERRDDEDYQYDSELGGQGVGNKTAVEQRLPVFTNWYVSYDVSGTRKKRDVGKEDYPDEEEITRQLWVIIRLMNCLTAFVGFIVFVLSIVLATLIFAPFCCYQKDKMANSQKSSQMSSTTRPSITPEKADISLWSDDAPLLQV